MEAIHKLKVICPYEIIKIEDIKILSKPNEHGYLYLKCLVDDSINFKYAIEATTDDTIILYEELESGEKSVIFDGIIENIRTTNENGIYYLELEGASRSSLLDIKEKTRSFQDAEMSYDNLINEILKEYKVFGFTQCMNRPMSIGKPLFQYKETDFEFLKRVASLLGLEVICDIINPGNAFYFGRPEGELFELKDELNYKACKDLERYYKSQTRGFGVSFHDTDFFYYEVESRQKMDIGDKIYFKQKDLYVNKFEAKLHKGEWIYKYRFCRKDGIWQEKIYNHKIKGISLEGEVLETAGEKLKIHLNIDESQDPSKATWFEYAPPTGNILYSMPLIGESAMLYFQDEIETEAIVTGCVRKNGSTCEAMSDTTSRYFATESGNYLDMLPGAINFHRSGLNVNFNDENGITISSSGNLSIGASGSVSLSGGSVSISAVSKLLVNKSKSSYISLENELYGQSSVIYESGSDRESYSAFTDDEPTAGVAEAKRKLEQQLKHADFKERQLMEAMKGSEAIISSLPEYKEGMIFAEETKVKTKALNEHYYTGTAVPVTGGGTVFTPDDAAGYKEANSFSWDYLKTAVFATGDFVNESVAGLEKLNTYAMEYGSIFSLSSKYRGFWEYQRKNIGTAETKIHDLFKENAPYKDMFDETKLLLNIAATIDGAKGIYSIVEEGISIGRSILMGKKLVGEASTAKSITEIEEFANNTQKVEKNIDSGESSVSKASEGLNDISNTSKVGEVEKISDDIPKNVDRIEKNNMTEKVNKVDETSYVKSSEISEKLSKTDIISKALNDSKTALAEHIEYIKNGGIVKPTGGKFAPSKVSTAIDTRTGEIYYGYSGKTGFNPSRADVVSEDLQKLVDNTKYLAKNTVDNPYADRESFELWPVDNCAEINAVDQALKNGAKMEDIFIRTTSFKTGEFADFCDNCKVTFRDFIKATE